MAGNHLEAKTQTQRPSSMFKSTRQSDSLVLMATLVSPLALFFLPTRSQTDGVVKLGLSLSLYICGCFC